MKIFQMNIHLDKRGGTEHSMWDLSEGLVVNGHEVSIVYHQKTGYRAKNVNINTYRIPILKTQIFPNVLQLLRMWSLIKKQQPDIVVLQNVYNIWVIILLAKIIPTVRFVRSHEIYCVARSKVFGSHYTACNFPQSYICMKNCSGDLNFPLRLFRYYYRHIALLVNKRLRFVFVASQYMKNNLVINGFPEESVAVIPPFVNCENRNLIGNNVLFVGRIEKDKGSDILMQIVAALPNDCKLLIVGDGEEKDDIEDRFNVLGLSSKVCFFGWLDSAEIINIYRDARVVVFPSL